MICCSAKEKTEGLSVGGAERAESLAAAYQVL